jgi:hypothetical protein
MKTIQAKRFSVLAMRPKGAVYSKSGFGFNLTFPRLAQWGILEN